MATEARGRRARGEIGLQAILNVSASAIGGVYLVWLVAYLVRNAGPEQFGIWATATAVLAPLSVLDAGLSYVVVRSSAARVAGSYEAETDARSANSLYAALGIGAILVGVVISLVPGLILRLHGTSLALSVAIAIVLAVDYGVVLATSAWGGILRGLRRYDALFGASLTQAVIGLAGTVLAIEAAGLVGAAIAQVVAHSAGRLVQLRALRGAAPWFDPVPRRPRFAYLRRVLAFAAPLLALSIAGHISFSADVIVVGAFGGAAAATWVSVGARLPALALSLAHLAADVMFPVYVEEAHHDDAADSPAVRRGLELAGFLGGAAFVALLLAREPLLLVWAGEANPVAVAILSLYSLAWLIHMPAHIFALLLIARGRHAALVPIVVLEALTNLGLSIMLVRMIGPIGVGVASLVAVSISNVLLIPTLAHRATSVSLLAAIANAGRGTLLGALAAVTAFLVGEAAPNIPALALGVQATTTALLVGGWIWFIWRIPMARQRI